MNGKSILVIGNVICYSGFIAQALLKGYRIVYTEQAKNILPFINQEEIKLIIVDSIRRYNNSDEGIGLMSLIRSQIPVILAKGIGFEALIMEMLREQPPLFLRMGRDNCSIDETIRCFFNGGQKEAEISQHLVFKREKDYVCFELNRHGNYQEIQERIKRAIAFIQKHYNEAISLLKIAQAAHVSPCHFSRLFKKQIGITCCKYLSMLRIKKAKELLEKPDLSITEICFEVGFNDLTHFERVFKGIEGKTPSAYRRDVAEKVKMH